MFLFTIWHLNSSPSFLCPRMRRRFSAVLCFIHITWLKFADMDSEHARTLTNKMADLLYINHEELRGFLNLNLFDNRYVICM